MECKTVKVKADVRDGYVVINEEDYDEETMELVESDAEDGEESEPEAPPARSRGRARTKPE